MIKKQKTIAIIEDDEVFRRGLMRAFSKDNYLVIDFCGSEDVSALIEDRRPDLILCDYKLPGSDGLEILNKLRSNGVMTPFLLMTVHFTNEIREEAAALGAAATFEKPLSIIKLRESCRKALKN